MQMRPLSIFLLAFLLLPAAVRAGEPVGKVQDITGHATILHEGEGAPHDVASQVPVFGHDVIEAGDDAHVTVKFADETMLVLSGKSKLTIDEYVYDPKNPAGNKAAFGLIGAAFSYVGGIIDKGASPNAMLKLDYGSIGIRGTKILGAMANGSDWIYLENGKATVDNDGGEVILNPGDGTSMAGKTQAPITPYAFSPEEIAWIQKMVDDPAARTNPAIAAAAPSTSRARGDVAANSVRAAEAPAASPPGGGGGPAAAAPASPSPAADTAPPAEAKVKAEAAAPAEASAAPAPPTPDVISLKNLSAAALGTRIAQDGPGIVRIDTQTPTTINIATADISAQKLENIVLHYSAALKAKDLEGTAYLEMWVHFPGVKGGNFFSRGLDNQLTKTEDWKIFQTPFMLKPGQVPDKVTLNLVINGHGTVWIKDVRLTR